MILKTEYIKYLIEEQGRDNRDLAHAISMHESSISKLFKIGKTRPKTAFKIAEFLGVTIRDITEPTGNEMHVLHAGHDRIKELEAKVAKLMEEKKGYLERINELQRKLIDNLEKKE
ncbi:MAG: helix-turn-helix domain-containing protein [Bacteroidales bacterium]|jgi:DNA-binding Xre family transcriptional regulator|nr:helix-turn-helix domain-containing protein [Bacteroidales bacterium]